MNKAFDLKIGDIVYYFDQNHREYTEDNRGAPIYSKHFRPIKIESENSKEFICDWGTINKRSGMLASSRGGSKKNIYTREEMLEKVFIKENSYETSQVVGRLKSADKLKKIIEILESK